MHSRQLAQVFFAVTNDCFELDPRRFPRCAGGARFNHALRASATGHVTAVHRTCLRNDTHRKSRFLSESLWSHEPADFSCVE